MDGSIAIGDRLINTPVFTSDESLGQGHIVYWASGLGVVNTTKCQLALRIIDQHLSRVWMSHNSLTPLSGEEEGAKKMPSEFDGIVFWVNRISITVGIGSFLLDRVPTVKSTGPMPRIPSKGSSPFDWLATPILG